MEDGLLLDLRKFRCLCRKGNNVVVTMGCRREYAIELVTTRMLVMVRTQQLQGAKSEGVLCSGLFLFCL